MTLDPHTSMTLDLDPHQRAAAFTVSPAVVVRAGPGAGKTRVLVARVVGLFEAGVAPHEVLVLAFTRSAAAEIVSRLRELVDELPVVTTFHGWAAGLCRRHALELGLRPDFTVQDREESDHLIRAVGGELGLPYRTAKRLREEPAVQSRYQRRMRESGRVDYDELEQLAQELLLQGVASPFRHVLVDEAQDTSRLEQQLLTLMAPDHLFLVGDTSQALFTFRGANPGGFWSTAGVRLELPTNYRSSRAIVAGAQRLRLEPPALRQVPVDGATEGQLGRLDPAHLVEDVALWPWGRCAILAPTWAQLDEIATQLEASGVPYVMARRGRLWSSPEGRRAIAALRLLACPHDRLAAEALLGDRATTPAWRRAMADGLEHAESIRATALRFAPEGLLARALEAFQREPLADAVDAIADGLTAEAATVLRRCAGDVAHPAELVDVLLEQDIGAIPVQGDRVVLSTIHGAKGREWDHVWVLGSWGFGASDLEARRMLYVAVTRARRTCMLVSGADARFVDEVLGEVRDA